MNKLDPGGNAEVKAGEDIGNGDWTFWDRFFVTKRWSSANEHNLQQERGFEEYATIGQRASFYRWFQNSSDSRGDNIRWPGAASEVANGVHKSTFLMMGKADAFMRNGNQIIFDSVFAKLRLRYNAEPLSLGEAAIWDSQILGDEQRLTQPLYESAKSDGSYLAINKAASHTGLWGPINWTAGWFVSVPDPFGGTLASVCDRWAYGMRAMGHGSFVDSMGNGP